MKRRDFIKTVVTGAVVVGAGMPVLAASSDPVVNFVDTSCGGAGPSILVGYASCCGSTGEIAAAIGKKLCEAGARADVKLMKDVGDPSAYDAFVLGSAIHMGLWMSDGRLFVLRNRGVLSEKPVALFCGCMAMSEKTEQARKMGEQYVRSVLALAPGLEPVALSPFAGKVDYGLMPKRYISVMKRINPEDEDCRDWDAINAWGQSVAPQLIGK